MKDRVLAETVLSMTGFASVEGGYEGWTWTVEMRGVNGRTLDLRLRLPDLDGLEPKVRKALQTRLGRGNVSVLVKLQQSDTAATTVLNPQALDAALTHLQAIQFKAAQAGVDLAPTSASDVASMRNVIEITDRDTEDNSAELTRIVYETVETCLNLFVADRAREGSALAAVMGEQVDRIETLTQNALGAVGDRETAQKVALTRSLERLLGVTDVPDEDRLRHELALIAVKTDVTEELDRLDAHVAAARDLLQTKGPVGRKLDFLMQEFNREANTLCSKAQSAALTAIGLDLKTVIEQMREQVQNIE
jgi:uncharacterized protein (TIGR00255 family)